MNLNSILKGFTKTTMKKLDEFIEESIKEMDRNDVEIEHIYDRNADLEADIGKAIRSQSAIRELIGDCE